MRSMDSLASDGADLWMRPADRSRFSCPLDVVESTVLAREEKQQTLVEWLADEGALLVADDEGMPGSRPSALDQVLRALRILRT